MGFIDPHGDVAEELLDCIPPHRTDDVAHFNPADLEYPVGLNPLQKTPRDRHHLVVDSIISTLNSIWGDVWGTGRMQYVMHHTLSALLFYDHATFLGVNRLLSDPQFRKKVLLRVKEKRESTGSVSRWGTSIYPSFRSRSAPRCSAMSGP